jgi:hypothetical protein
MTAFLADDRKSGLFQRSHQFTCSRSWKAGKHILGDDRNPYCHTEGDWLFEAVFLWDRFAELIESSAGK